ncbi:MAG: hypothetical protein KH452_13830 [Clostridiales bacterium]|nr:hypothetical protein [Clostridiales bacterium]
MKLKYPAEAFALGILMFSAGMKEAFSAGILVILAVVSAEFLKNLLEPCVPEWSWKGCVYVGTAAVCGGTFLVGFTFLGIGMEPGLWIMTFLIGLLAAKYVVNGELQAEYGELFWETALIWGFWVLLAAVREFCGTGEVFGKLLMEPEFRSRKILDITFAFLTAGLALAFTNGVLKKKSTDTNSLLVMIPAVIYARPFVLDGGGELVSLIWTIAVPLILFLSVKRTLRFSRTGAAFRGLPAEMLSMGFIYMILSIY